MAPPLPSLPRAPRTLPLRATPILQLLGLLSLLWCTLVDANCQTDVRTWNIVVLRPPNSDGQRVLNAINLAVAQSNDTTHALYLAKDTLVVATSTSDDCTVSAAASESAGTALATALVSPSRTFNASVRACLLQRLAPSICNIKISYFVHFPVCMTRYIIVALPLRL